MRQLTSIPARLLLFALLTITLALPHPLFAQEATVLLSTDGAALTVGDVTELTLEIHHPAGTVALVPTLDAVWGELEVRSQSPVTVTREGDLLTSRQTIEVALFAPGDFQTSMLVVTLVDENGGTSELAVAPVALTVASVLTDADTVPRDIKAQADFAAAFPLIGSVALVLALAMAGLGGWWLWRKKGLGRLLTRSPLQRVLDQLDAIAANDHPARAEYKQLYLAVSDCVRGFAHNELGLPMQERTTSEMRSLLRHSRLGQETGKRMLLLFNECDLVKFSQVTPTPESAKALLAEARALVTQIAQTTLPVNAAIATQGASPQVHG